MMPDRIFVECCGCDGSGHKTERQVYFDRDCGWFEGERILGVCEYCHGFGSEEIEAEPVTLEDLEVIPCQSTET